MSSTQPSPEIPDRHDSPANLEDLTPEEASRIIHSHRKVRYGTACWPCRQRKVKCDNKQPCENCVKREHPQLCSYRPNRSGKHGHGSSIGSQSIQGQKRVHSPDEDDGREHSHEPKTEPAIRAYADPEPEQVTRYLGQNSIPALLRESNEAPEGVDTIRADMRSILGLDNSAPFPLMSARHLQRLTSDISAELPSDREVMKLFRTYKEIPQLFWGFVADVDDLESKLMVYLEERAKNAFRNVAKPTKPVSASWLAILFAVLAVGSQYHDSPYHVRTRDSQKYIQISFHFLRLGNFLLRPNFDSIQALLMTSFVLLNDMKAEASWALLGLTCRLAQSLGLHRALPPALNGDASAVRKDMVRRKLWWCCVWHDTLTSLSFDRFPITNIPSCPLPMSPTGQAEGWNYLESMYQLCNVISQRLNPDAIASANYVQMLDNCQSVEQIREKVLPNVRTKEACKSAIDRLQYFAIRLHTAFVLSVCCRPALKRGDNRLEPAQRRFLADKCKENLAETVRMFLAMHQLSVIPTRSWAFTYHGLSSAVLLGLLSETKNDPEVRQLQGDLISALSATAAKDQASPAPFIPKTDKDIELSGPLSRALTALKNLYDHGSIVGASIKREFDAGRPGNRPPVATGQSSGPPGPLVPDGQNFTGNFRNNTQQALDPHQDAALAMAEMQNGTQLQDFPGTTVPFVPPISGQPNVTVPDLSTMDPSTFMEPMDLYDSIFWESPDPWNTGVDSMNFDFLAQPPPGQPPQQQFYF